MPTALFTPTEVNLIQSHALAVWDYIAFDCLHGTAEMTGKDVEAVTMSRSDVIEMVLDADRLEESLRGYMRDWTPDARADFFSRWESLDYRAKRRTVTPAFAHTRYGL